MDNEMELFTMCRVRIFDKDALRATATVQVAGAIFLTGLRVIEGKNGLFLAMPSRKMATGEYQDIYFPSGKAVRDELQKIVLDEYEREHTRQLALQTTALNQAAS